MEVAPEADADYVPLRPKQLIAEQLDGKRISHIQFGTFSKDEVSRSSELEVLSDKGYEQPQRTPVRDGVLDRRLGVSDKQSICGTCGSRMQDCPGHFGHIKLVLPVFHIGYLKSMIAMLQSICKVCSRVLVPPAERPRILRQMAHPLVASDHIRKAAALKRVVERCKKVRECPYCQAVNGIVKKVGSMRIVHEKYKDKDKSERADSARHEFAASFEQVRWRGAHGRIEGAWRYPSRPSRCCLLCRPHPLSQGCDGAALPTTARHRPPPPPRAPSRMRSRAARTCAHASARPRMTSTRCACVLCSWPYQSECTLRGGRGGRVDMSLGRTRRGRACMPNHAWVPPPIACPLVRLSCASRAPLMRLSCASRAPQGGSAAPRYVLGVWPARESTRRQPLGAPRAYPALGGD